MTNERSKYRPRRHLGLLQSRGSETSKRHDSHRWSKPSILSITLPGPTSPSEEACTSSDTVCAMSQTFSYDWLAHQLQHLQDAHGLWPFRSNPVSGIMLRHDVDFDVVPALRLAELEHAWGLQGSYFFMATAETYNLKALSVRRMVSQISFMGFEVALHFDPTVYGTAEHDALAQKAQDEAKVLEDIVGSPVVSLSLHNPSRSDQSLRVSTMHTNLTYSPKIAT